MNIDYIREFAVLADTLNYLEAAEKLYISQSTLSKHIQTVEKELGMPLFERSTRHVRLTRQGNTFLAYAKKIAKLQEDYTRALAQDSEAGRHKLKLGSLPIMKQYRISTLVSDFKKQYPDISMDISEGDSDDLINLMLKGSCELAFLRCDDRFFPLPKELEHIPFSEDELVAMTAAAHPLAGKASINLSELSGEDFLMFQEHSQMNSYSHKVCEAAGFEPKVSFNGRRPENLADLASHGLGVALLMKKQAGLLDQTGIHILELTPAFTSRVELCWLKGHKLSPAAKEFTEFAAAFAAQPVDR